MIPSQGPARDAADVGRGDRPVRYVLGIDGGGTKTAALLGSVDASGAVAILGRGAGGPSNPRAAGLDVARRSLRTAVEAAWASAQCAPQPAELAILAIAGTGQPDMAAKVCAAVRDDRLAVEARTVHDADPVLVAGTPDGWGVALIAGTGSSAVAVSPTGKRVVCGGWGYRFGDEGSGYWLGREATSSVARAADGRSQPTLLTQMVLQRLRVTEPREILAALIATGDERSMIASLAPLIAVAVEQGDGAALDIIERAAAALAELVRGAAREADLPTTFPLALAGGVICNCPPLRESLQRRLAAVALEAKPTALVPEPAQGCVKLAAEALR